MTNAAVIGTGGGVSPMVLTVTQDVPANGSLLVCFQLTFTNGNGSGASQPTSASDNESGHPWTVVTSSLPIVGLAAVDNSWFRVLPTDPFDGIMIGAVGRQCVAGDMHAGALVTVNWLIDSTAAVTGDALLLWVEDSFVSGTQRGGLVEYVNSDGHPNSTGDVPPFGVLSWFADEPSSFYPNPDGAWTMVSIMASWPGGFVNGWFSPGTTFHTNQLYVNVSDPPIATPVDPGGGFGGAPDMVVGNFQFLHPLNPTPATPCAPCAQMLGGVLLAGSGSAGWI